MESNHRPQHYQGCTKGWSGHWYTQGFAISYHDEPPEDSSCHFVWARSEVDNTPIIACAAGRAGHQHGQAPCGAGRGLGRAQPRARWLRATFKLLRAYGVANLAAGSRLSNLKAAGQDGCQEEQLAEGLLADTDGAMRTNPRQFDENPTRNAGTGG